MKLLQYLPLTRPFAVKSLLKKLDNNHVMSILDLEDSIQDPFNSEKTIDLKLQARKGLKWLSTNHSILKNKSLIFIRINSNYTNFFKDDLNCIKECLMNGMKIDGLFLPKIDKYDEIEFINNFFFNIDKRLLLVPIIETVLGYNNLSVILKNDLNNNLIYGVHYGHFDYCLDANLWPFPDPFHYEFWNIIEPIVSKIIEYDKIYFHTPFPFLKNNFLFWGSENKLKEKFKNLNFYLTSINIDISLSKKPKNIERFKLKNISKSKDYHILSAKKIIRIFTNNRVNKRSFAISDKRFIPPHQYFMAKNFLENKIN